MSMTIAQFKTRLQSKIHGTSVSKVQDVENLIAEAAGNLLRKLDPVETRRITQLENALYDQVYSYVCPADLKKDRIIDIRPQVNRTVGDNFSQSTGENFGLYKTNNKFSVDYNSLVKTIKISKSTTSGATLNDCNSLTSEGTWAATASAENLEVDSLNYITGSASLRFDLATSGSSGYIENSTFTAVDLTNHVNTAAIFVWVYLPSASAVSSVALRWGSSSANYYSRTVTATHDNTAFVAGWNLLRFNWDGATETGTVVDSAIDYLRVTFAYGGTAVSDIRVDSIMSKIGSIYEIVYYSNYLFRTSGGTWIEAPTDDSDLINLDSDSVSLLLYETAELVAQELQGEDGSVDLEYFKDKAKTANGEYMSGNKSEAQKRQTPYYRM